MNREEIISGFEKMYFQNDYWTISAIKNDLQNRKTIDLNNSFLGRRSNNLYEKRRIYEQTFDDWKNALHHANSELEQLRKDNPKDISAITLYARCGICLKQIDALISTLRDF